MIRPEVLKQIINAVKKRGDWQDTLPPKDHSDEEFLHAYMYMEFLGKIVVLSEFYDRHENNTEWLVWEGDRLREATDLEDYVFRAAYNEGLRDEADFWGIISRDHENKIFEGDSEFAKPEEE